MRLGVYCLILLLVGCDRSQQAAEPLFGSDPIRPLDLRGELAVKQVALLEEVELRIDLYHDAGIEVEFEPDLPEGVQGEVVVGDERPWMTGFWRPYTLRIRPTELGELRIASLRATALADHATASTPEFTLQVTSLLGDHGGTLEAPAPLFPARVKILPWVLIAAACLLLLVWLVYWLRRSPKLRTSANSTPLPAHTKALRALSRLRGEPRETDPEVERFYQQISSVLRTYLEDRYGLHAPERTTEEFLPEIEASGLLAMTEQQHLSQFLQQCDLVKFARLLPEEDVHAATFDFAERLVEHTREDRQEVRL